MGWGLTAERGTRNSFLFNSRHLFLTLHLVCGAPPRHSARRAPLRSDGSWGLLQTSWVPIAPFYRFMPGEVADNLTEWHNPLGFLAQNVLVQPIATRHCS